MSYELKFSIITASLDNLGDRFLTGGYKEPVTLEKKCKRVSELKGITGVELCYDPSGDESDAKTVKSLLKEYSLNASVVNAPLTSSQCWKYGSLSAPDKSVRIEAVESVKKTIEFALGVGAELVNLWMGQDGFDYSLQVDYTKQWENMIDGIRECADYEPEMQIALEFKPREPRNRALLNTATTTLLMINDVDRINVGVTVDSGHVLQHGENMAQVVELCSRYGKLFNLHLNDNYSAWDDDMIVGSVHLIEYLELLYVLRKIGYNRWCAIDIFPFREDAFQATQESVNYMIAYNDCIERIGDQTLSDLVEKGNVTDTLKSIRTTLFA